MEEQINAFAPETNEYVSFPASYLDAALAQGYRIATPEDKQRQLKKELIEQNNPVLSRVAATLAPAADTATFGAFGAGLKNVAPDLAEIADITQESHPNLATAGTVAGFAGSFVPGAAIAKGGQAVKAGVQAATGSNLLARGAQFGAEGLAVAAPKAAVELTTGNPELAGEELLGSGGIMAAIGLAVGAGEAGLGKLKPFFNYLGQKAPTVARNADLKALGTNQTMFGDRSAEQLDEMRRVAKKNGYLDMFKTTEAAMRQVDEDVVKVGSKIGNAYALADEHLGSIPGIDTKEFISRLQALKEEIPGKKLSGYLKRPITETIAEVKALATKKGVPAGKVLDEFGQAAIPAQAETSIPLKFTDIFDIQKTILKDKAYSAKATLKGGAKAKVWEDIRNVFQDTLEEGIKNSESLLEPGLYKTLVESKAEYSTLMNIQRALKNKIKSNANRSVGLSDNIIGSATGVATGVATGNAIKGALSAAGAVGANKLRYEFGDKLLARTIDGTLGGAKMFGDSIGKHVDALFSSEAGPAARVATTGAIFSALTGKPDPSDATKAFVQKINEAATNPTMVAEQMSEAMPDLSEIDPAVGQSFNQGIYQTLRILQQNAPIIPEKQSPFDDDPPPLSKQDIDNYESVVRAVLKPGSVVKDVATGNLDPAALSAFKVLYPNLYDSIKMRILDKTTTGKHSVPYSKRMGLGMFFGKETDALSAPQRLYSLQQNYKKEQQEPNKSRKKPTYGDNLETQSERIEKR